IGAFKRLIKATVPLVMIVTEIALLRHCRIKPKHGKHDTQLHHHAHGGAPPGITPLPKQMNDWSSDRFLTRSDWNPLPVGSTRRLKDHFSGLLTRVEIGHIPKVSGLKGCGQKREPLSWSRFGEGGQCLHGAPRLHHAARRRDRLAVSSARAAGRVDAAHWRLELGRDDGRRELAAGPWSRKV